MRTGVITKLEKKKILRRATGPKKSLEDNDWLLTYGDAVTLLLTFLVLLLSVSTVDQAKYEQFSEAIKGELSSNAVENKFEDLKKNIEETITEKDLEDTVEVESTPTGIKVEFGSSDFFAIGKADIRDSVKPALMEIVEIIKEFSAKTTAYSIEVEGHTDDVPIRTVAFPSNWELSAVRATNVVKFFIKNGIDKHHLKASGFSSLFPILPNKDINGIGLPNNRAKNRRIEIFILRAVPRKKGASVDSDNNATQIPTPS